MLNQQALKNFRTLFYASKRANEKQAQIYWQQAEKIGFSLFCHNKWYYEFLSKIFNTSYQLSDCQISSITAAQIKQLAISIDTWKIVLLNGYFMPKLSSADFGPYQIKISDTLTQFEIPTPITNNEVFLYLIESLAAQPLLIKLKDNQQIEKPLYILNITNSINYYNHINTSHYRYHLDIGDNCKSQVIEHFVSIDKKTHLTGGRLTVNVGKNSFFSHIKLNAENNQSNHFAHNDIILEQNSQVKSSGIFIGSSSLYHRTSVKFNGIYGNLTLNGLFLPQRQEIVNAKTYIEHNNLLCKSNQLYKIIALDKSKVTFNGLIKVAPTALKTYARITNNNLLLGKHAEIYTKPQLEIYADDVKCSHKATVGHVDDNHLFYLCSRGICLNDAKYMILVAFSVEVIEAIDNMTISQVIMNIIHHRLMVNSEI